MAALPTVLDLDQIVSIPVKLAGREFKLTQQSQPVILRVLKFVNEEVEPEEKPEENQEKESGFTDAMARNLERALPYVALMFGYEQDDTTKEEVVAFLKEHLHPSKAIVIFQTWWQLNEVDDFFARGGKVMMHPDLAASIKKSIRSEVEETLLQ